MEYSVGSDLIDMSKELNDSVRELTFALEVLLGEFDSVDELLENLEGISKDISVR